jgi:hypothetical protein
MLRLTAWRRWAAAAVLPRRFLPTAWDFGGAWGAAADFLPADAALEDGFPPAMTQRPLAATESGVNTHPSVLKRYGIRQTNRERSAQQVFSGNISGNMLAAPGPVATAMDACLDAEKHLVLGAQLACGHLLQRGQFLACVRLHHRVTQIMNLLNLAPDIQEAILFIPRTQSGRDPISERQVRSTVATPDWRKQRRMWSGLGRASC